MPSFARNFGLLKSKLDLMLRTVMPKQTRNKVLLGLMTRVPSPPDMVAIVAKLSDISRRGEKISNGRLPWPSRIDFTKDGFWSEDLDSLNGTEIGASLDEKTRQRLRLQELRNLFSVSFHSEQKLILGLRGVRDSFEGTPIAEYLDVFTSEERRHSFWFKSFCDRYCHGLLPDELPQFSSASSDQTARIMFLSMAFLVESVLDIYNRRLARDMSLHPIVRRINHLHSVEEARHMSFDRAALLNCVVELEAELGVEQANQELIHLADFLGQIPGLLLNGFCSPNLYAAAGIEDGEEASRQALQHGPTANIHKMALASSRKFLDSIALLPQVVV
jgi:hypothetical protein